MEEVLQRGLVGQDEAIATIAKCIRLSRAGLRYHDRPLGVFLMIGPTVSIHIICCLLSEFLGTEQYANQSLGTGVTSWRSCSG